MLAARVATPVMRQAQLWTDFQQTGISVQRLGDILNTRGEVATQRSALPPIAGAIAFEGVHFRYRPQAPEVLCGIDLAIAPGEVIGIVGRSGSGKSGRRFVPAATREAPSTARDEQGCVRISKKKQ